MRTQKRGRSVGVLCTGNWTRTTRAPISTERNRRVGVNPNNSAQTQMGHICKESKSIQNPCIPTRAHSLHSHFGLATHLSRAMLHIVHYRGPSLLPGISDDSGDISHNCRNCSFVPSGSLLLHLVGPDGPFFQRLSVFSNRCCRIGVPAIVYPVLGLMQIASWNVAHIYLYCLVASWLQQTAHFLCSKGG